MEKRKSNQLQGGVKMKEYNISFMDANEFEALSMVNPRYQNTKDDFGFADTVTNRIFVRKTGLKPLDMFITAHEIEEILAKNSSHEDEFKIRHKKGRDIFAPIGTALLAMIPGIGPPLAAVAQAGYTAYKVKKEEAQPWQIPLNAAMAFAGGKMAQGSTGYQAGVETSKAAGGKLLGQTLSGAQGMLGFTPGAVTEVAKMGMPAASGMGLAPSAASKYTSGLGFFAPSIQTGGANLGRQVTNVMGQPVTLGQTAQGAGYTAPAFNAPTALSSFTPPKAANIPISSTTPSPAAPAIQAGGGGGEQATRTPILKKLLGENWEQTLLGASIPLAGQMFTPGPQPFNPEQSQLFQETANMVRQGAQVQLTPAQQQAITANYDTALEKARQNIMDRYKALRPGSDISNDSQLREALTELETEVAEKKANALASAQLGLSQTQTQMMSELAAMDIYTLAMKAGISSQEARDFKQMLSQLGFMVATGGQPIYS